MSVSAICPSCGNTVTLEGRPKLYQQVVCKHCDAELEVVELTPVELDWVYYDDDDYDDDEWDEQTLDDD